jgi:NTE family protein
MLFHLGALWRLNELGYLPMLSRVSSVSGGSITAGVLGLHWSQLEFSGAGTAGRFGDLVVARIRELASVTIDRPDILKGIFLPGSVAEYVAGSYRTHLFGTSTLQDLPDPPAPRFVLNATNVQSGALWRFSKPFMADWRVGLVPRPTVPLATAVGASSAFPPVLSPARLDVNPADFQPDSGADLQKPPYTTHVVLTDGGVYDNLGLETAWKNYKTILVSDGGGHMAPDPQPHADWARQSSRVNDLIDNQVRDLRQRQLISSFNSGQRAGTYWAARSDITHYPVPGGLPCPIDITRSLAAVPTRLAALDDTVQEQLINWGYAICDAAMRSHMGSSNNPVANWPYPARKLG